jgi:hypothetical protein
MKKTIFKDDKGHTIYLVSDASWIYCECPYCKILKNFDRCSQLNKTGGNEQNKV